MSSGKKKKKNTGAAVMINKKKLDRIVMETKCLATEQALLVFLAALQDGTRLSEKRIIEVAEYAIRYNKAIEDKTIGIVKMHELIKKNLGVVLHNGIIPEEENDG